MKQAMALTIQNRAVKPTRAVKRHSASFVASVAWLFYAVIIAYVKAYVFDDDNSDYYFRVVPVAVILAYQFYHLLKDLYFGKYKMNLITAYFLFVVLQYIFLRSGLERVITLSALLTGIMIFKKYPLKKSELITLYYVFAAMVLIKIANGTTAENSNDTTKFNSNQCAISLMMLFCASLVILAHRKRVLYLIIAALCIALQFYFTSRNALGGCILFALSFCIFKAWKRKYKASSAFVLVFALSMLGILVAYIYSTVLYEAIGKGQITILGKDLFTGRQKIWAMTFDLIKENLWFGVGSHVNEDAILATGNDLYRNAHNMPLAVLASFGIIHFILFYLLFSRLVTKSSEVTSKKHKYVDLAPILYISVITVMNYLETLFFYQQTVSMIIVSFGFISCCHILRKRGKSLPLGTENGVNVG
ncbi:MAG: O-antigen ligase family protein [Clostridiales bacterium]|nr:O-antigen ligase family protein [Clostridiales bacterium]